MKKKVYSKGYTITVTSWENDGDNYNTKSITVDTIEKAKAYNDLMQLCRSKNNQPRGVVKLGNTYGNFNKEQKNLISEFFKENTIILPEDVKPEELIEDEDLAVDMFSEISYELLGSSEDYSCRVMQSCSVTYSPEDVFLEEVKF